MGTKGVFLLGLFVCWTVMCNGEYGSMNDYRIRDKLAKLLAEEDFQLVGHAVGKECTENTDCDDSEKCEGDGADKKSCKCADGLSGENCEIKDWCGDPGQFINCKAPNGTCEYDKDQRKVVCKCAENQAFLPDEKRCRECVCGSNEICSYKNGQKECNCDSGFAVKNGICTATCSSDNDCKENQKCGEKDSWKTCVCADGLSGDNCENKDWCNSNGKFKNCKGVNGTCEYKKEKRAVDCTCDSGKELHPTENRCRETCTEDSDCEHGGECKEKFCNCKLGLIGDKCNIVFDCSPDGKYKNCIKSGGNCKYDTNTQGALCACPEGKKLHDIEHICKATCSSDNDCKDNQKCVEKDSWKTCVCADGLSGDKCDIEDWCKSTGIFKNCKGVNGTCKYKKEKRAVDCTCDSGKKLHPTENRCRATCASNEECKNSGTCEEEFCSCKSGIIGDKCEVIFDCTPNGKYKGCTKSGGTCTFDGSEAVCNCPDNKKLHDIEHICKECDCGPKGVCKFEKGQKKCECEDGFGEKDGKCTATCTKNDDCKDSEKCVEKDNWKSCKCGDGLSGENCDKKEWCETGKFKNCKGVNGTCEYSVDKRAVDCTCADDKQLHPTENRCRDTCANNDECKNGGTCSNKFCSCKLGLLGDKCDIVFDCTDGKYKGCEKSDGTCTYDGTKTECKCPDSKIYDKKEHICKETCTKDDECRYDSKCEGPEGQRICSCKPGLKGERCEIVEDCVDGKFSKCESSGGECKFDGTQATCTCLESKGLDPHLNYCKEKCGNNNDCQHGGTCDPVTKLCSCKKKTSGDKCENIEGCDTLKCDGKDAKCIYDENTEGPTCECLDKNYYYEKGTCQPKWCKDGCNKKVSTCEFKDGVGICKCNIEGTYYDYFSGKCEPIDKCFNKTCNEGEVCKKGDCECADNYQKNKEGKCERKNLCDNKNICFLGAKCKEGRTFGLVRCVCNDSQFYNPKTKKCEDGSCFLWGKRKECKEACPRGMKRTETGDCKAEQDENNCEKDCGRLGYCFNRTASDQECLCDTSFSMKDSKTGRCVLKARAVCPTQEKDADEKCKCTGQYKSVLSNGISCELKSCSDEDVQKECKNKGAEKCVDDWKGNGYKCVCPFGYSDDKDKGCIDPCSMDNMKATCASKGQGCYLRAVTGEGDCRCLPSFAYNSGTGKCEPNGKNAFMIHSLPVLSKKYETGTNNINKVLLNIDVRYSMLTVLKNLDFVYVFSFTVKEGVVLCDVWLQFQLDAPENFNASLEVQLWKSQTVEAGNKYLLPPALFLSSNFKEAKEEELSLCSPTVKQLVCGRGSTCSDDKCACDSGFREIESTLKAFGDKRIIRCEDIDECLEGKSNCSANSECKNTVGSYFCKCNPGYRKANGTADALNQKACIGLCEVNPCGKGTCQVTKEHTIDCTCQAGYSGSFCNKEDVYLAKASNATKVVGAVLGTLLAIVIVLIIFYIVRQRKNSYSEDLAPAPRIDNAEMAERRPMRGVTNRAYQ